MELSYVAMDFVRIRILISLRNIPEHVTQYADWNQGVVIKLPLVAPDVAIATTSGATNWHHSSSRWNCFTVTPSPMPVNHLCALLFWGNIKIHVHLLITSPRWNDTNNWKPSSWTYFATQWIPCGCRCPGDTKSQGIGSHGITCFPNMFQPNFHGHNRRVINHAKRDHNCRDALHESPTKYQSYMNVAQTTLSWLDGIGLTTNLVSLTNRTARVKTMSPKQNGLVCRWCFQNLSW